LKQKPKNRLFFVDALHSLNIQAPIIALGWCLIFHQFWNISVDKINLIYLVLAVWLIYTWDHILDEKAKTNSMYPNLNQSKRHVFHSRFKPLLLYISAPLALILALGVFQLDSKIILTGATLSLFVGIHLLASHFSKANYHIIKDLAIGFGFTAGCALPCISYFLYQGLAAINWLSVLSILLCFVGLATRNCQVIAKLEKHNIEPISNEFKNIYFTKLMAFLFVLQGLLFLGVKEFNENKITESLALYLLISFLALELLEKLGKGRTKKIPDPWPNILADFCLMVPLIFLIHH